MIEILILRGLSPSKIDELIKYYRWFPNLTIMKSSKMINDILKKRQRNIINDFIEFNNDLRVISERYFAKMGTIYSPELLYKVLLWHLYHKFVLNYDYLKDLHRND